MTTSNPYFPQRTADGSDDALLQALVEQAQAYFPEFNAQRCTQRLQRVSQADPSTGGAEVVLSEGVDALQSGLSTLSGYAQYQQVLDELTAEAAGTVSSSGGAAPVQAAPAADHASGYSPRIQSVHAADSQQVIRPAQQIAFPGPSSAVIAPFDIQRVQADFPILAEKVNGGSLLSGWTIRRRPSVQDR